MSTTYQMRVEENYFHLLKSGAKTVELRLNDPKRQKININDKIQFFCKNNKDMTLRLTVCRIDHSENFANLIKKIPIAALGGFSEEQQLVELRKIYDIEEEKRNGVVALFLGEEI